MHGVRNPRRRRPVVAVLLGVLAVLIPAAGQQAPPTLDAMLQGLESNLLHYHTAVPAFFCDERVVSERLAAAFAAEPNSRMQRGQAQAPTGDAPQRTVTDSIFRLRREIDRNGKPVLTESREVRTIDGVPAKGGDIGGPDVVRGAFSGGIGLVSLSQKACMKYKLQPFKPGKKAPYVIQFDSVPAQDRPAGCLLEEDGSGRVFIDRATMQTQRIELTVPHHPLGAAIVGQVRLLGVWNLAVDYAPVALGTQIVWMPTKVTSTTVSEGPAGPRWSYTARYSNFHKLEVTTRMIPADGGDAP
jgi:hypothetical protein